MNRREALAFTGRFIIGATACGCASGAHGQTSSTIGFGGTAGCLGLSATGYSSANALGSNLLFTSGIPGLDRSLQQERDILDAAFLVRPVLALLSGQGATGAFATRQQMVPAVGATGTVMFGTELMQSDWYYTGAAIAGIMAHEWAHICQFTYAGNTLDYTAPAMRELHADCLAGWYVANRIQWHQQNWDAREFMYSLFEKGDFQFNSPQHHGTPAQRVEAMMIGFRLAAQHPNANISNIFNYTRGGFGV